MYPLQDYTTMTRRAAEGRRAAEAAGVARRARTRNAEEAPRSRRGVRHALGASLVRAGVRLINA
jgi:hypothetical protein